jgi:hypothetical protein
MRNIKRSAVISLTAVSGLLVACSGGGGALPATGGASGAFSFNAVADGAAPAGGKVVVIWSVSSGSPDYSYSFGSGSSQGTQVFVSFSGNPPAEALNSGVLGIGIVAVVESSVVVPEGRLSKDTFGSLAFVSPRHAVVFRGAYDAGLRSGWDKDFPQGFACGECVDQDAGFDSFRVVDCSTIKLVPYSKDVKFCNWT